MANSFVRTIYHITFWKKVNAPLIETNLINDVIEYFGGIINQIGGNPIEINTIGDHVHILTSIPKVLSVSQFVEKIKSSSSRWIKTKDAKYKSFYWQTGYGGFSVHAWEYESVRKYIQDQEFHHQNMGYREEFIKLLKKHDIDFDERYLCDE